MTTTLHEYYMYPPFQSSSLAAKSLSSLTSLYLLACKMLSFGRKSVISLPKWTWKNSIALSRASSSSSFIKLASLFGSKKADARVEKQGTPGRKEYYVPRKFVPMTRKALIRRIVEDENLVSMDDRHYFQGLAEVLDKSIAGSFHGTLGELKVILCITFSKKIEFDDINLAYYENGQWK